MKRFLLFSLLTTLFSMMGLSSAFAEAGDSADDPRSIGSGTSIITWTGDPIWFSCNVPAGRILNATPSEGTIQADLYECYEDIANESSVTKTFSNSSVLKYENNSNESKTIYLRMKNVLNATDFTIYSYFDYVTAPVNTSWETATEITEGTLTLEPLSTDNAPLWFKLTVPSNKKMTAQKNFPHSCLVYEGADNAAAGPGSNLLAFNYGSTVFEYTNTKEEATILYFQFYTTVGFAPHTMNISFEDAAPVEGSAWNCPFFMAEGGNNIKTIGDNADPVWYACKVGGRKSVTFKNEYWPILVSFYNGDEEAKNDAEPSGSNFATGMTKTFENQSASEKTVYMKVVYSIGFAQYANVSVAFEDLGEAAPTADAVVGNYTGTYSLVSASAGWPAGHAGSLEDRVLTVTKNTDNTVDITTPTVSALDGVPFVGYTIKNVEVDEEGNITGGNIGDESFVQIAPWGSATAFSVSGKLDGTNADVTINITANAMGAASDIVMTFKTPVPEATADAVVGEYTGTYSLISASAGWPAGHAGTIDNKVLTVKKSTANTVEITTPSVSALDGVPFVAYTINDVTVDADGNISGGSIGDASFVQIAPWGSATAFSVSGKLDGTNADVTINITANAMGTVSDIVMAFQTSVSTAINHTVKENMQNVETYNLMGVRVDANYNGIVISNGKKYLRK